MQILFLICFCLYISFVNSLFCFWNSGCPYRHFSTKTPYNLVRGDIRDSQIKVKGCKPVSIWSLYRNGKSYPDKETANHMENAVSIRNYIAESYTKGKCSLCAQDVDNLINWKMDTKLFKGINALTDEGYQEMYSIANRLKATFPDLFSHLKENEFVFRPTAAGRIEESARAFVNGIDDRLFIENVKINDTITPYTSCGKYESEVKSNPKTYEEAANYQKSSEYLAMKDRVERRTGLDFKLTDENVTALYDLCRFTWSGINGIASPWCALFTSEDLQVLEYVEDLNQYYKNGHGSPTNVLFGRIILTDLLKTFQRSKAGEGKKITTYFGQSTAIDMALSSLGLFKDKEYLRSSKRNRDRKWKSYKMSSFSANIMAVLSRCNLNGKDDYTVVFYLNEEPIKSICLEGICPWNEFEEKFKPFLDTDTSFCDFNAIR
ncbi:unnamed protein product [Diatraea saccharalis]|uniref:Multiple inositol polyphosphate phosphatase 1 n=1 Tax=Diatraea saccharalis TaxID=40085 RepID=A0A9N9W9X8_9NEOP|nr:unnamed protein product [Diatraea saccharalis]